MNDQKKSSRCGPAAPQAALSPSHYGSNKRSLGARQVRLCLGSNVVRCVEIRSSCKWTIAGFLDTLETDCVILHTPAYSMPESMQSVDFWKVLW